MPITNVRTKWDSGDLVFMDQSGTEVMRIDASEAALAITKSSHSGLARQGHTVTPVAAAGSTVADAGQLPTTNVCHITSDGATKGVKLPTVAAGDWGYVINNSATACEFYAASGGTVNGLSANASVVVPASKGLLWFATGANTVIAFDMAALATAS